MPDCGCGCRPARHIPDTAYVAHACSTRLERRLRESAELWEDVETTVVPRRTRLGDPTPRAGRPAPAQAVRPDADPADDHQPGWSTDLPYSEAASETAASVRNTLTTWARVLQEQRHETPPADMADLTRWVAGRLHWARYEPWAPQAWPELDYAAGLLWQVCDRPVPRQYLGPCGEPDGLSGTCTADLYGRPGADVVRCPDCGTRHSVAERRHWLDGLVLDYAYTPSEIEAAYGIRANTIRKWASRHRLVHHSIDRHGRLTYLLREVLDLAGVNTHHSTAA